MNKSKYQLFATIPLVLMIGGCAARSESIHIYGNSNGLWSPSHPQFTGGRATPVIDRVKARIKAKFQPVVTQPETTEPEGCPTQNSAPHLCPPL